MRFSDYCEVRVHNAAMQQSQSGQRDIGRIANDVIAQIIKQNKGWDLEIEPIGSKADVELQIDGYFKSGPLAGKSCQIIRRIAANAKDDFAIQIVKKQYDDKEIRSLDIGSLRQKYPSKLDASAEIHIMLNAADNAIFLAKIEDIRQTVEKAISEMQQHPHYQGVFAKNSFSSRSTGVFLRIAQSREGYSVLAYVPAQSVSFETISTTPQQVQSIEQNFGQKATVGVPPPQQQGPQQQGPQINPNWVQAMEQALANGQASFPAPNNKKLIKPFQRFAAKKGVQVTVQGNQVILTKLATT